MAAAAAAVDVKAAPEAFDCAYCKQPHEAKEFNPTQLKRARKGNAARCRAYFQAANRKSRYGMTADGYRAMWSKQRGCCAVCVLPMGGKKTTHVDHDHVSKVVRGLLCVNCNTGLGQFYDNPLLLLQAALYLWASTPTARPKASADKARLSKLVADMAAAVSSCL